MQKTEKVHIPSLPIAANVCEQMLREVERNAHWSMAHVVMNPGAFSLLHKHHVMDEVYIVTRGFGELIMGNEVIQVSAGSVIKIPASFPHKLINKGVGSLEHLVLALPPFDPADIAQMDDNMHRSDMEETLFSLPPVQECFDGAKIIPYEFPELNISIAFGWVINDPERRKRAHIHQRTTEWIYIAEGSGIVEVSREPIPVVAGDWVRVDAGLEHAIRNRNDQYMVAVCMCDPKFDMLDVHYRG